MAEIDALLRSLRAAVQAMPDDATLRLHLAERLLSIGDSEEALGHVAHVLSREPASAPAQELMRAVLRTPNADPVGTQEP